MLNFEKPIIQEQLKAVETIKTRNPGEINEQIRRVISDLNTEPNSTKPKEDVLKDKKRGEHLLGELCEEYEKVTGFPAEKRKAIAEISGKTEKLRKSLELIGSRHFGHDYTRGLYKDEEALAIVKKQRRLHLKLEKLQKEEEAAFGRKFGPDWRNKGSR